jgi:hypothetical protein
MDLPENPKPLTEIQITSLGALGGSEAGYCDHLKDFPDDSWEDYLESLEYAYQCQREKERNLWT